MVAYIPNSLFTGAGSQYLYLFSRFGDQEGADADADAGFEEWWVGPACGQTTADHHGGSRAGNTSASRDRSDAGRQKAQEARALNDQTAGTPGPRFLRSAGGGRRMRVADGVLARS